MKGKVKRGKKVAIAVIEDDETAPQIGEQSAEGACAPLVNTLAVESADLQPCSNDSAVHSPANLCLRPCSPVLQHPLPEVIALVNAKIPTVEDAFDIEPRCAVPLFHSRDTLRSDDAAVFDLLNSAAEAKAAGEAKAAAEEMKAAEAALSRTGRRVPPAFWQVSQSLFVITGFSCTSSIILLQRL